jgi:hypothetical protein
VGVATTAMMNTTKGTAITDDDDDINARTEL